MSKKLFSPFDVLSLPQAAGLSAMDKLLFSYLTWRRGANPTAWPSLKTIQRDLQIDRRTCLRTIARLIEAGCITKVCGGGREHPNHYTILPGEREAGGLPLPAEKGRHFGSAKGGEYVDKGRRAASRTTENNIRTPLSARARADFDRAWSLYPKRVGRQEAWLLWQELSPDSLMVEQIIASIHRHVESEQWSRSLAEDGGRFIPRLAKFLERRQWEDSPAAKPEPQRGDLDWLPSEEEADEILARARAAGGEP